MFPVFPDPVPQAAPSGIIHDEKNAAVGCRQRSRTKDIAAEHAKIAEVRKKPRKGLPDQDGGANMSRCAVFSAVMFSFFTV
jgi:hypothetical protein